MSSFIHLISDGCVDFEKCGDVVVSPKDNIIGMYCHFCCDIFTNTLEFLHHLQWMHSDVIAFTKEHNVYTIEELMSLPDRSPEEAQIDGRNDDSEVPTEDSISDDCLNKSILNALAAYDVDCGELNEINNENAALKCAKVSKAAACENQLELKTLNHDQLLETTAPLPAIKNKHSKTPVNFRKKLRSSRLLDTGNRLKSIKKWPALCNLRSYAIARSARKREQQQRLGDIRKRIFRCLENDKINSNSQFLKQTQQSQSLKQQMIHKLKPLMEFQDKKIEEIKLNEDNAKENIEKTIFTTEIIPFKADVLTNNSTNKPLKISSSIIINKIEYLPKIDLNWNTIVDQLEKPKDENTKPCRRSSLTIVSSPRKKPNRRPSYSEVICQQTSSSLKPKNNKRKQTVIKTSTKLMEVVEAKRSKGEDNSSGLQADSNISKLEAVIIQQTEKTLPKTITDDNSNEIKMNTTDKTNVRDDLVLLQLVGLPIVKDSTIEERKPFKYVESLHLKATNFSKLLQKHETVWNPKRFTGQLKDKLQQELEMLTKAANLVLKTNLNVNELKRILNLIYAWYVQQINQKFFKKVVLSQTLEYYVLLFGFLPKINRCLYYCEWCGENCVNNSRYEKHRLMHQDIYSCPHCQREFKKRGFLINHVRTIHGKEL